MTAVAFDTLKVARRLAESGLDARTAEGVSAVLAEAWTAREGELATKADIREVKGDIRELRAEIKVESRTVVAEVLKRVIGSQIALTGLLFAAIKLL